MEIFDESDLTEYEIERQRNVIKNHEFMKSCGLTVKPLVYVKRAKVQLDQLYDYTSSDDSDSQDEEWNCSSSVKQKREESRIVPDFKRKIRKPLKYLEKNSKKKQKSKFSNVQNQKTKNLDDADADVENFQQPIRKRQKISAIHHEIKKEDTSTTVRYPKRCERKNYKEDDVPDDDHYIFCEECEEFYFGECPIHDSLIPFADKTENLCDDKKSLATLPDGLAIKESSIPNAGLGVLATQKFEVGVRFGPYQGKKVRPDIPRDDIDTSYMWEIMKDGHVAYYINGKDEKYGNWMRYINCSRVEVEQNLVAFQYHREIYYRTYKEINIGDELLVWYGDDYAKDLGIKLEDKITTATSKELQISTLKKLKTTPSSKFRTSASKRNKIIELPLDVAIQCENCLKKFKYNSYYENHLNNSKCNLKNTNKKIRKVEAGGERKHECSICEFKCTQSGDLKRHMRIHTNEKPYECSICEYKCNRSGHLKQHMRIHTNEKPYECSICEYKCTTSGSLKQHMRIHTNEKPYECSMCEYKCTQSGSLKQHMRIHTNEKPYECSMCEYKCNRSGDLKLHMRIHTNEKPYECSMCEYKCTQSGNLKQHMRIHTNEKPYECSMCEYKCNRSGDLKLHMRIHTNEKPYECSICEYKCNRSGSLKRHMRIH